MPASATIEERVTNLEHEVRYLKAFAGPGQNEALSQNVAEIRVIVTNIKRQTDATAARIANLEMRQGSFDDKLSAMNQLIQEHGHLLGEILRRLPRQADPADN
jgi:hypothetical protein